MGIEKIRSETMMQNVVVPAGATVESKIVDLNDFQCTGSFSVQYIITGTGTASITFEQTSIGKSTTDASNFLTPSAASAIGTGLVASEDCLTLATIPGVFLKLLVEETGSANPVTVTLILTTQ